MAQPSQECPRVVPPSPLLLTMTCVMASEVKLIDRLTPSTVTPPITWAADAERRGWAAPGGMMMVLLMVK
jgi:hypothetical protein